MNKDVKDRLANNKCPERIIILILTIITSIGLFFVPFLKLDHTPATYSDFEELIDIAKSVPEDPSIILETYGKLTIDSKGVKYELENDECSITAIYDENFQIIDIEQKDFAESLVLDVLVSLFFGFACGLASYFIYYGLFIFVERIIYTIKGK